MAKSKTKVQDPFIDAASKAVRKAGWSPRYDLEILKPDTSGKPNQVRYGYRADKVRLLHSPDLFNQVARVLSLISEVGQGHANEAFYDIVASRVYLQIGGFKVCPYSIYDYHEILDACSDGLRSAGANESEVIDLTVPITSFFIASVVTAVYSIQGPDSQSMRIGWPLDHIVLSFIRETMVQTYIALYVNIQLRLWSDNQSLAKVLKMRFPQPFDGLEFETDRGVAILLDTFEFVGSGHDGLAWSDDGNLQEQIVNELKYVWRKWPIKAFQWAEMIGPYIIAEQHGRQLPPQPQPNSGGRGSRPSEDARQRRDIVTATAPPTQARFQMVEQKSRMLPGAPLDPFADRLINDSWFRQRLMQIGIGRGKSPLDYFMGFEALDTLYQSRATSLEIKSEITHKKGAAFGIAHITREELGASLPGLNDIDWGATRINPDGNIKLYKKTIPITDKAPVKLEIAGFPDLLFIVDSSGSMGWNPKTGSGPYDSLLRAVYSVLHFLEQNKKAQYMQFAAVNFSGSTFKTNWCPFSELRKVKELLFKHQNGGTQLNCSIVQQIINTSTDRFLCLMVTDAQIGNAPEVFNTIKMMTDRGHGFVFIQIGRPSPLTNQIRNAGLNMHIINNHKQLEGLCLDYAKNIW